MAKQEKKVHELIEDVENNQIRLPEMQRGYVWKSTQVRDLVDSLYRKYPAGNILMWETSGDDVPTRNFAVGQKEVVHTFYNLLLDGQQRITSLSKLIRGNSVNVRDKKNEIDIYFNLDHPEKIDEIEPEYYEYQDEVETEENTEGTEAESESEALDFNRLTFIVESKKVKNDPNWVSVRQLLNSKDNTDFLKRANITGFDDPRYSKYNERLNNLRAIKDYVFNVITLDRKMSYEEVTEIFVRVNSAGTRLRGSDLALAQITAKWRGSLALFEEFQKECKNKGYDLDLSIIVRALVVIITGQVKFKPVSAIPLDKYIETWEKTKRALSFALDFMQNTMHIADLSLLTSPYFIVLLAYYFHSIDYSVSTEISNKIMLWYIPANAKGRYSRGSMETLLDQDVKLCKPDSWLDILKAQFGKLEIDEIDLEGKFSNSGFYKNMFLIMKHYGAKDWETNLGISLNNMNKKDKIESHHIIPQDLLKKAKYPKEMINDIANLAFVGKKTNGKISNSKPEIYLKEYLDKGKGSVPEMFVQHCIPTDTALYTIDRYPDFLKARRKLIAELFGRFLGELG